MVGLISALEGITRSEAQFNKVADRIAHVPPAQPAQGDQVDLSAEAVALLQSRNSLEANTRVLKVADELEHTSVELTG